MKKAKIIGTGSYLPEGILTNEDLMKIMDTSDEWITTRTGIKQRHISTGENVWEMAVKSAERAVENAKIDVKEIDAIICSVVTPDYFFPNLASIVQGKIGAVNANTCFDINIACSGYVGALNVASDKIACGKAKNVLVIASECLSRFVDYKDRTTSILFGDGSGSVVLQAVEEDSPSGIIDCVEYADGTGMELLTCRASKEKTIFTLKRTPQLGTGVAKDTLQMNGQEVFKFAVSIVPKLMLKIFERNNMTAEDLAYFVPHQANLRIIDAASRKAGIPKEKVVVNIQKYGNTSSASVAICLDELYRSGKLKEGDSLILTAFGAGLCANAMLIKA